jgi:hypothetical protein
MSVLMPMQIFAEHGTAYEWVEWVQRPTEKTIGTFFADAVPLFDGLVLFTKDSVDFDGSGSIEANEQNIKGISRSNLSDHDTVFLNFEYTDVKFPLTYEALSMASGMFRVQKPDGTWWFIQTYSKNQDLFCYEKDENAKDSSKTLGPYAEAWDFNDGIAWVKNIETNLWGAVDTKERRVVNYQFEQCISLSGGLALVKFPDNALWVIVDKNGRQVANTGELEKAQRYISSAKSGNEVDVYRAIAPSLGIDYGTLIESINKAYMKSDGVMISADGADIDPTVYWVTDAAMTALTNAIGDAENALTQAVADALTETSVIVQNTMEAAALKLDMAANSFRPALGHYISPLKIDFTGILAAIEIANERLRDGIIISAIGTNVNYGEQYVTSSEMTDFVTAVTAAQAALASEDTQNEIDNAAQALSTAINTFVDAIQTSTRVAGTSLNYSLLNSKITEALFTIDGIRISTDGANVSDEYQWVTSTEMNTLNTAIMNAQVIFPAQDNIDNMATALSNAINAFKAVRKPGAFVSVDYTELKNAIAAAYSAKRYVVRSENGNDVDPSVYWAESADIEDLIDAIEAAQETLTEYPAEQSNIDSAVTTLNNAVTDFNSAKVLGKASERSWIYIAQNKSTGADIVDAGYYEDIDASDRVIKVMRGGKWGVIDKNGNVIVECIYDDIVTHRDNNSIPDGLALVTASNGKKGLVSHEKIVLSHVFKTIEISRQQLGIGGEVAIIVNAVIGQSSAESVTLILDENCEEKHVNSQTFLADSAIGYTIQIKLDMDSGKYHYVMMDSFGSQIVPPANSSERYDYLSLFVNGYSLAEQNGKFGLIKMDGEAALDPTPSADIQGVNITGIKRWTDAGYVVYNHALVYNENESDAEKTGWGFIEVNSTSPLTLLLGKKGTIQSLINKIKSQNTKNEKEWKKSRTPYSKLIPPLLPEKNKLNTYTWMSMNTNIAVVDSKGKVEGRGPGNTSITLFDLTGRKSTSFEVNVVVPAKKIEIPVKKLILKVGDIVSMPKFELVSSSPIYPANTDAIKITSKIEETNKILKNKEKSVKPIAVNILSNFELEAKNPGKDTIKITELYGNKKASIKVEVYNEPQQIRIIYKPTYKIKGTAVNLNPPNQTKNAKENLDNYNNGQRSSIRYPVVYDNSKQAGHTEDRVAIIEEGKSIKFKIDFGITEPDSKGKIKDYRKTLHKDDTIVSWTVDDPNIIRVDDKGKVIGISAGESVVTATASNGFTDSYKVIVHGDKPREANKTMTRKGAISERSLADSVKSRTPYKNIVNAADVLTAIAGDTNRTKNVARIAVGIGTTPYEVKIDEAIAAIDTNWETFLTSFAGKLEEYYDDTAAFPMDDAQKFADTVALGITEALKTAAPLKNYPPFEAEIVADVNSSNFGKFMLWAGDREMERLQIVFESCTSHGEGTNSIGHSFLHDFCGFEGNIGENEIVIPVFTEN